MTQRVKFSEAMMTVLMHQNRHSPETRWTLERIQRVGMIVQSSPHPGRVNVLYVQRDGVNSYRTYSAKDLTAA